MKTVFSLFLLLQFSLIAFAQAAAFDSSTCPKRLRLEYSDVRDALPEFSARLDQGSLVITFELADEATLQLYRTCAYRGKDTHFPASDYWEYGLDIKQFPTPTEFFMQLETQIWVKGRSTQGYLTFPSEKISALSATSVTLATPEGDRPFSVVEPQYEAGFPVQREAAGTAGKLSITVLQ